MRMRNDLDLYEQNADRWWKPEDRFFRSLRSVGEFHLGLIQREWGELLEGARVVELGCGGGFMSMALSRLGAKVTGVDWSEGSIRAAREQAKLQGSSGQFLCADLRDCPLPATAFDLVVMPDVLEHLDEPAAAFREASRLLRPGGRLFLSTFDRTWRSSFAVVTVAEGLGLVPRGTHDARLFVRPSELRGYGKQSGMSLERLVWERPAVVRTALTWTIHLKEASRGPGFSAFLLKEAA